jgi:hypothetical protein
MIGRIRTLQNEVSTSAQRLDAALVQRLDAALVEVGGEVRDVRRIARALSPKLLIGVGLAGGFLLMVLPRHLRGSTLLGLGNFALTRLLPLLAATQDSDE